MAEFGEAESSAFGMDVVENAEGESFAIPAKGTPLAHDGLFSVEPKNRNRVMDLGHGNSTRSMGTPGLSGIHWHRSLESGGIVELGL